MPKGEDSLKRAIELLSKLPGVGPRTAFRFLQYLLDGRRDVMESLGHALLQVSQHVNECPSCHGWTEGESLCDICRNPRREDTSICVVATVQDQGAIERAGFYYGKYHILHGCLSPLDGIGPDELRIQSLLKRLDGLAEAELILATPPTVDGEATAMYIRKLVAPFEITVSRIASGVPIGDELQYVDKNTLSEAFRRRH